MAKRAIIYCRTATTESFDSSTKHQAKICREYANKKNYQILEEVKECGSGLKVNKGLAESIRKITKNNADVLIASEPTRISRDACNYFNIRKLLGSRLELLSSSDCKNETERLFREEIFMSIAGFYGSFRAQQQKRLRARQKTIRP